MRDPRVGLALSVIGCSSSILYFSLIIPDTLVKSQSYSLAHALLQVVKERVGPLSWRNQQDEGRGSSEAKGVMEAGVRGTGGSVCLDTSPCEGAPEASARGQMEGAIS